MSWLHQHVVLCDCADKKKPLQKAASLDEDSSPLQFLSTLEDQVDECLILVTSAKVLALRLPELNMKDIVHLHRR